MMDKTYKSKLTQSTLEITTLNSLLEEKETHIQRQSLKLTSIMDDLTKTKLLSTSKLEEICKQKYLSEEQLTM